MVEAPREQQLAEAFASLADTLVGTFDVIDFLHGLAERCVDLLNVTAAGVLLSTSEGQILDVAASDARTRQLELDAVSWDEGPCHDCYHTGAPLLDVALAHPAARERWPNFTPRALGLGFTRVTAAPLRLRDQVIGALNLFHAGTPLDPTRVRLGRALADVATMSILSQRAMHDSQTLATQLQQALNSRIIVEQAKGSLAARRGIDVEEAFALLRQHARRRQRLLTDIAREVIEGSADPALLDPAT